MNFTVSTECDIELHHKCDGYVRTQGGGEMLVRTCHCRCHVKDRTPDLVAA